MRINRETLHKLARETVTQRTYKDRTILAAYLSGALLEEDYLLGGAGDIDLTFIHIDRVSPEREIVRLSDDVHLDIAHHAQKDYSHTKKLRLHPWLGPTIYYCQTLYDPQHIMDFTQASVRGQFDQPENVLERANSQVQEARRLWLRLTQKEELSGGEPLMEYFSALEKAVNAIALVSGPPLTERRFLMNFKNRAGAVGQPGLYEGLMGLLGSGEVGGEDIHTWLTDWDETFKSLEEGNCPPRLHPARRNYYLKGIEALLGSAEPRNALWSLLHTWTLAVIHQKERTSLHWEKACQKMNLQGDGFREKVNALDSYLDLIEETIDNWGRSNGVEV